MRCVVDSHVVGVAKPDPAIFAHAAVHFPGITPECIAYVGDSVTLDVGGARAAGLHPILVDPYDDHPDADRLRRNLQRRIDQAIFEPKLDLRTVELPDLRRPSDAPEPPPPEPDIGLSW